MSVISKTNSTLCIFLSINVLEQTLGAIHWVHESHVPSSVCYSDMLSSSVSFIALCFVVYNQWSLIMNKSLSFELPGTWQLYNFLNNISTIICVNERSVL